MKNILKGITIILLSVVIGSVIYLFPITLILYSGIDLIEFFAFLYLIICTTALLPISYIAYNLYKRVSKYIGNGY